MLDRQSLVYQLLKYFYTRVGQYISGEALAKSLGVSRVTIWKLVESLKKHGFHFESVRNKGYCLLKIPDVLHQDWLQLSFESLGYQAGFHFFETISSTNTEGLKLLADGAMAPAVLVAKKMTAGRGRLGRNWHATDLGNLYISFIFRPKKTLEHFQCFSLWIGCVLCRYLKEQFKLDVKLKWPNDLCVDQKKIAGILMESTIDLDIVNHLVLGIGLNVNTATEDWPLEIAKKATTLAQVLGKKQCLFEVATVLFKAVFEGYQSYVSGDYVNTFMQDWATYDLLYGKKVIFQKNGESFSGKAYGINEQGCLKIDLDTGENILLNSGEVSLQACY